MYQSESQILEDMQIVRDLSNLGKKLRAEIGIPLRQPILDFAFGFNNESFFLEKDYIIILAEDLNIWNVGIDYKNRHYLADKNHYYLQEINPPKGDNWKTISKNNLWISLYINMPEWLKKIGDEAKERRQKIMNRKNNK